MYKKLLGKPLPQNLLLVPVQYLMFNQRYYCTFFLQIEEEIGCGTFKRVEKATVIDIIGSVPSPKIHSLKGTQIALYRPRDCHDLFVNDIKDIIKLDELLMQNYIIKGYISRIIGHSLFLPTTHQAVIDKYTPLINENKVRSKFDLEDVLFSFKKSIASVAHDQVESVSQEILSYNDLINIPYMFSSWLPYDLLSGFTTLPPDQIYKNVYSMVAMVGFYASEGIFFRDLSPNNFRLNENKNVKLIDPSYIAESIRQSQRYKNFIKQTTPEYLPNEFTLLAQKNQSIITSYFGKFTEGVCIGMLERVLKRIFLPKYMKTRYDELFHLTNRIEKCHQQKLEEDIDLFKQTSQEYDKESFIQYRKSIYNKMLKEGWSEEVSAKISRLITTLRKFSKVVIKGIDCESYLKEGNVPIAIGSLPSYIAKLLQINPADGLQTKSFPKLNRRRTSTRNSSISQRRKIIRQSDVENYVKRKTERVATPKITEESSNE